MPKKQELSDRKMSYNQQMHYITLISIWKYDCWVLEVFIIQHDKYSKEYYLLQNSPRKEAKSIGLQKS